MINPEDKVIVTEGYLPHSERDTIISAWIEQEFRKQLIEGLLEGWEKAKNDNSN